MPYSTTPTFLLFSAIRAEAHRAGDPPGARRESCAAAQLLDPVPIRWDTLVVPLEEMQHRLSRTWSPVGHMNGVVNSDELRAAYNACLPLLTAWHTDLAQNEQLYRAYETHSEARRRAR